MAFEKVKVDELREAAEYFDVDTTDEEGKLLNKETLVAAFAENGVTPELYNGYVEEKAAKEEGFDEGEVNGVSRTVVEQRPEPKADYLIKMNRGNASYETHGVKFSRQHPFALVTRDVAEAIFETEEGFSPATPREAKEYYS